MASKRKVELTFPWTDREGAAHERGEKVELADLEARKLIRAGRARDVAQSAESDEQLAVPARAPEGEHYDHVHWAMSEGGAAPKLYDEGGYLPPRPSGVENQTASPEPTLPTSDVGDPVVASDDIPKTPASPSAARTAPKKGR